MGPGIIFFFSMRAVALAPVWRRLRQLVSAERGEEALMPAVLRRRLHF